MELSHMTISMYSASVPVFTKMLQNLSLLLTKAQADAEARKYDPSILVNCRLAPDMFPLTRQIFIACDAARQAVIRIAGTESVKFEDTEITLPELQQRIQKTLDFLATVRPEQLDGTEDKDVTFPVGKDRTRTMKAEAYLKHWATPNVYFHITTAYAILRHNGVPVGKQDFLLGTEAF
jgi:hypothetical protein